MIRPSNFALGVALWIGALLPAVPAPLRGETAPPTIVSLKSPAAARSGEPCLAAAADGGLWMSWFEKIEKGFALRVARLSGASWSPPATVARSDSFFVNWADFPRLASPGGERLAIAWPWKHGGTDPYAYDLRVAFSIDGGETWGRPVIPHRDGTASEHGFVSLVPRDGGVDMVWLDGRKYAARKPKAGAGHDEHDGEMTVRAAWVGPTGSLAREAEIDPRACDCCNTSAVPVPGGILVAYRDRSPREIRDISVARLEAGRWSPPVAVHADGWKTPGCPVNGPALDAIGNRVVVAWFAMVGDTACVQVAFSGDGGGSFGSPVRVAGSDPLGRVDVALLEDGSALVGWLDAQGPDALLRAQRITSRGPAGDPFTVGHTSAARASGFPRMVRDGGRVVFAWTETDAGHAQVRVAAVSVP